MLARKRDPAGPHRYIAAAPLLEPVQNPDKWPTDS
jgi:hypothetical protein